jgi:hypothetical protein
MLKRAASRKYQRADKEQGTADPEVKKEQGVFRNRKLTGIASTKEYEARRNIAQEGTESKKEQRALMEQVKG